MQKSFVPQAPPSPREIRSFWDQYNAATASRSRGDFAAAAESYQKALEIDPRHEESLFYLATCLQEIGRYPDAVATLRRLTELYPTSSREGFR